MEYISIIVFLVILLIVFLLLVWSQVTAVLKDIATGEEEMKKPIVVISFYEEELIRNTKSLNYLKQAKKNDFIIMQNNKLLLVCDDVQEDNTLLFAQYRPQSFANKVRVDLDPLTTTEGEISFARSVWKIIRADRDQDLYSELCEIYDQGRKEDFNIEKVIGNIKYRFLGIDTLLMFTHSEVLGYDEHPPKDIEHDALKTRYI